MGTAKAAEKRGERHKKTGQKYEERMETAKKAVRTQENVARALSFSAAKPASSSSSGDVGDATIVFPELPPGVKEFTSTDRYDLSSYQDRLKTAEYKERKLREKLSQNLVTLSNHRSTRCDTRER